LKNDNLRWETTDNFDAGIEMGFLKDRITFEFNYYSKRTKDVLMELTIPASNGFDKFWDNVGIITNKGVEFSLKTRNIYKTNFKWITEFNVARNYNNIQSIGVYSEDAVSGGTNDTRVVVGSPVGTNYLIRLYGIDPNNGLPIYLDKNGNQTYTYDNKNRVPVGNILPKAIGGLTNTFTYKRFDLNILFVFSLGSSIYESSLKRQTSLVTNWTLDRRIADRWTTPGQEATYMRLSNNGSTYGVQDVWMNTDIWLQNGSYARLRNLSFSYNLDNKTLKKLKLRTAKVTFIATNILTITKYKGIDPEIARDAEGDSNGGKNTSRNMGAGNIAYLTPTQEKTFNLAISIGF
ncbi:MAG: TonB-dependent receptor, partial [Bacteroidetes bacterium]|nr:TonB-dependent receptor [Bacteroidota bacterium]